MKFLTNENFPLDSAVLLKEKGIDIIGIGVDNQGISDLEILTLAAQEHRTILTFDRDYGELIFKYGIKPSKGVIYLRIEQFDSDEPGKIVLALLSDTNFILEDRPTVVTRDTGRQRKY